MDYVVVVSHNLMLNIFFIKVRGNRIEQRGISFLKSYVIFSPYGALWLIGFTLKFSTRTLPFVHIGGF